MRKGFFFLNLTVKFLDQKVWVIFTNTTDCEKVPSIFNQKHVETDVKDCYFHGQQLLEGEVRFTEKTLYLFEVYILFYKFTV